MRVSQIISIFTSLQCLLTLAAQNNENETQQTSIVVRTNMEKTRLKDLGYLIATDIEDFYSLVERPVFADKTLLVEQIFSSDSASNILITYPKKWGKSVNLAMIRSFARTDFFRNGTEFNLNETSAYLLFKKGAYEDAKGNIHSLNLGDDLFLISHKQKIMDEHLGRYFVIHLSLMIPCYFNGELDYDKFMMRFKDQITKIYAIYSFVWAKLEQKIVDNPFGLEEKYYIERFNAVRHETGTVNWSMAVKDLCDAFQFCYPKHKILITIDDYDYICNKINFQSKADYEYKSAAVKSFEKFIHDFMLSTFGHEAQNKVKPKCIITGISRLAKTNIFPATCNFEHWSMNDEKTGQPFYGFTAAEVQDLLSLRGFDSNKYEDLVSRYDGYRSRKSLSEPIFNPRSIVEFLNYKELSDYWLQSGRQLIEQFPLIFEHFQFRYLVKLLTMENVIKIPNNAMDPTTEQLDDFAEILRKRCRTCVLRVNEAQCALGILVATGYLGLSETQPENENYTNIRIPNTEVRSYFKTQSSYYDSDYVASYYESLRSAAIIFRLFLNDLATPNELETSIRDIFKVKGPYGNFVHTIEKFQENSPTFISDIGFMHQNEAGAHFTMIEVFSLIQRGRDITLGLGSEVGFAYNSDNEQHFSYRMDLACFNDDSIMIIGVKTDNEKTIDNVLQQAEDYLLVFKNRSECRVFKNYKLVAINVREHDDVEVKFKTLSHTEVLEYHTKWTSLAEKAIKIFAERRTIDYETASLQWRNLAAMEAKHLLGLAREELMANSTTSLIPPEILRNLPEELRCPVEDWNEEDVSKFLEFFDKTVNLEPPSAGTVLSQFNGECTSTIPSSTKMSDLEFCGRKYD
ncbi:uncharacterized protein LOC135839877 isoform X2 [Planococcus citri]|uniref:uncharacterized protein LOC135839877 isoform X2 n=1 Tax=Planococcus citri TaxID=170843 RepID=UPI0031FA3E0F